MVYDPGNFPYYKIKALQTEKRKSGNQKSRKKRKYIHNIAAFDIETTRLSDIEQSFMFVWQFAIEGVGVCVGRSWPEFLRFLSRVKDCTHGRWFKVFVHNLSYEFQFLRGVYDFSEEEVFIIRDRKILKCEMLDRFEFCCSYLQTNMSLAEFTKDQQHAKTTFDYDKTRYPWTELTEEELEYITNDVAGLIEAMRARIDNNNDNLYSLPATSTGYVRREAKRAMRTYNKEALREMLPDTRLYTLLRESFRGGDTHCSRYYTGDIVENVLSMDRSSSYPDVIVNDMYPMGAWTFVDHMTIDEFLTHYLRRRACVFSFAVVNPRLVSKTWPTPYLAFHKCKDVVRPVLDNGRILSADYLITTMTDVDFRIFISQYDFDDFWFLDFAHTCYKPLPQKLRDLVIKLYKDKTELKGVAGKENQYNRSKAMINSVYGMMVQDPARQEIKFRDGDYVEEDKPLPERLEEANKKAFLSYAWGCWVTAWARFRLWEAVQIVGESNFVYCDTDSVKFLDDVQIDFTKYNNKRIEASRASGAYARDPAGAVHYMGVYEQEKTADRFLSWGAKKYAYEIGDDLYLTCAGVHKKKGAAELKAAGGLEAFREGFVFKDGGGTESVYNDHPEVDHVWIGHRMIKITSNVVIRPSEYTLGLSGDYRMLLYDLEWFNE